MEVNPAVTKSRQAARLLLTVFGLALSLSTRAAESIPTPDQTRFFETHVRPLLAEHCLSCHGESKQKGGLRLDSRAALLKGGKTGPILDAANLPNSRLLLAI